MADKKSRQQKSVQELESPVVDLHVDLAQVDKDPAKERPMGRAYPKSRSEMPENQLFEFAEYHAQDAERTGYSNYSYWRSVWANFLKKKSAVIMSVIFILLFIFTFVGSAIGKYSWEMKPVTQNSYIAAFKGINPSPEGFASVRLTNMNKDNEAAARDAASKIPETLRAQLLLSKDGMPQIIKNLDSKATPAAAEIDQVQQIMELSTDPEVYARIQLAEEYAADPEAAIAKASEVHAEERTRQLLKTDMWGRFIGNLYWNNEFWFGTNGNGKDYWAQVWYATRASILLAVGVSLAQIILGVIIGLIWGYIRPLDRFFTELYNLINNIPTIIYMTLIALLVGKTMWTIGVALVLFGWLPTARNVRNLVFIYRDREYNLASRCLGTSVGRVLFRNIFPYLVSVIILRLALAIPSTIAYETTLTYLGLMDITVPSLGNLLRDAKDRFLEYPHLLIFPALIVSVITITFYLVGNAFSDASDPRNHV